MKHTVLSLVIVFSLFGCTTTIPAKTDEQNIYNQRIPLVRLLTNPQEYHGKIVEVIGVVRFEFEGNGIYLNKEHYEHRVLSSSLWLSPSENLGMSYEELQTLNGRYAYITGTFNMQSQGHLGMNAGTIENITSVSPWR